MFIIIGRRWFNKKNGNTYHSVEVYKDNKQLEYVPFAYGYDDHYKQTALDLLVKLRYYPNTKYEVYRQFTFSEQSCGDGNFFSVSDVGRKKDL